MKYGEFNINQAVGVFLCNDIMLGEKFFPKGHKLTPEDIIIFKMFDLRFIYGAVFEDGDIDYKIALHQIAAQICGSSLGYLTEDDKTCKICAAQDGIFLADENRIDKFNGFNEEVILNTIAPYSTVKVGDVVAELEIVPPFLRNDAVDDIVFKLSGNESLLSLSALNPKKGILIYAHLQNDETENRKFTSDVMGLVTSLDGLGIEFQKEISCAYDKEKIADALFDAFALKPEVIFVLSPLKSSGRNDVVASAVRMSADEIINHSFPQVNASDLLIAQKNNIKIITLPCAYDEVDNTSINRLIKRVLFSEHLSEASFTRKRAGCLNKGEALEAKQINKMIMPHNKTGDGKKASIGAVVLAAGQGKRAGCNKLMVEDKNGQPMFIHAVNAAIKSDARPVFVVTGYRHEEMEEWLDKLDVNVLYNPSYASGIKTSINMGLKSIPSSCDGAILLPADMPYIGANELNKLINGFDKTAPKQICMLANKGAKHNPVLWSKSLYDKADIVPENAQMRVVFAEHSDYLKMIEVKDKDKLKDINFPNDVTEFSQN